MGRETETTVIVNVGVAQVGGTAKLGAADPLAASLEFNLVPGGEGAELLAPDGTLRTDLVARLVRYTTMSFHSTRARVRRDGRLEFTGELTITHVTRESIPTAWNSANTFPDYTDPAISHTACTVSFVLASPRAESLAAYLQKQNDLIATATVNSSDFPELPGIVLDSYWPAVAQDEQCAPATSSVGSRDYSGFVCSGKAITITPSYQRAQTFGVDYSGLRKHDAPTSGPVTILLHLKLAPPPPTPSSR